MSFVEEHYGHHAGLSAAEYVQRHVRGSPVQMARIRDTVALIPPEARSVLDVGAGYGVLLEELKAARGVAGIGVEIAPSKVDYAQARGVDLRLGSAERLPFADKSFDAVLACEVIEHLPFQVYERALAELARVARHAVLVSVPNEEQRSFVRCPYCGASVNPSYHFRSFSPASLNGLFPGFRLAATAGLGSHRSSPLLRAGLRWVDAGWPASLVCACCGYRAAPAAARPGSAAEAPARPVRAWARRLSLLVPARRKPTWLVGVYLADGTAAKDAGG